MSKSAGEEELAFQLRAAKIDFIREVPVTAARKWKFDFVMRDNPNLAVEVEGGAWTGGHKRGAAADTDCEKANTAAILGIRVLRFTPAMVEDGRALATIVTALKATTA